MLDNPAYSDYVLRRSQVDDSAFNALAGSIIGDTHLVGCTPPSASRCLEPVTDIGAIVDQRQSNLAASQTSGIDWVARERVETRAGKLDTDVSATYILDYRQRVTPTSDSVQIVNTAGNPPRLRLRAGLQWKKSVWYAGAAINFTSGYSNKGSLDALGDELPLSDVASWSTFDLQFGYVTLDAHPASSSSGMRISLVVTNVFDHNPPYVDDHAYGLGYDPSNANPFGRQLSVEVRKLW
jgi:hypothetical protein